MYAYRWISDFLFFKQVFSPYKRSEDELGLRELAFNVQQLSIRIT